LEKEEYVCISKECKNRNPFANKSCSVKEDFLSYDEETSDWSTLSKCYYLKKNSTNNNGYGGDVNDDMNNINIYDETEIGECVTEEKCPTNYPGV
jgi:hypothetical protein